MPVSVTERLLVDLNKHRGLKYPDIGFTYFADVRGTGNSRRQLWTIINSQGGVRYSDLNAGSDAGRCNKLRAALRT